MKGDFHVRFRENVRVKFPRVTRLAATIESANYNIQHETNRNILIKKPEK